MATQHIALNGGLDLISAPPAVLPGAIRKCLNYEVGYRRGYARIDGFERYDGKVNPSTTNIWFVRDDIGFFTGTFQTGEALTWATNTNTGACGVVISYSATVDDGFLYFAMREGEALPIVDCTITGGASGATYDFRVGEAYVLLSSNSGTPSNFLTALQGHEDTLRNLIGFVPGGGRIVAHHVHLSETYAVRDVLEGDVLPDPTAGTPGIEVGQYLLQKAPVGSYVIEVIDYDPSNTPHPRLIARPVEPLTGTLLTGSTRPLEGPDVFRFSQGSGGFAIGDNVQGDASTHDAGIFYVEVRNGSFEAGNAEGIMVLGGPLDALTYTTGETATNTTQTGALTIEEALQDFYSPGAPDGIALVQEVFTTSSKAAMYRATTEGWVPIRHAKEMPFDTGTTDPDTISGAAGDTGFLFSGAQVALNTETPVWVGALSGLTNANDSGPSVTLPVGTGLQTSDVLSLSAFQPVILDTDVITGFSVKVRYRGVVSGAGTGGRIRVFHTPIGGPTSNVGSNDNGFTTTQQYWAYDFNGATSWKDVTFGGVGAFWGERQTITPAQVRSSSFSFEIQASSFEGGIEVDYVQLKVHYTRPVIKDKWYIWDGSADVGWVRVSKVDLSEGAWDGSAEGEFTLWDWSGGSGFDVGDEIRTAAGGAGSLIAKVAGGIRFPYLPGSRLLDQEASQYILMSHNFLASEDTTYLWGVNGAGKAFYYDGESIDYISTGVEDNLDKPRHIAETQGRLALGYDWGEVFLSGAEDAAVFSAETLGSSHGFGARITGLASLTDVDLAVFTEKSVHRIHGAALDSEGAGVSQHVISAKAGAIEYTVEDMGNLPVFCSFQGVRTLEATEKFGGFQVASLSEKVTPWLVERLQKRSGFETEDKVIHTTMVVRSKNQYRMFFNDGWILTLTLFGAEREPQLTFQRWYFNSDEERYARVYAASSGVQLNGRERLFFSTREHAHAFSPNDLPYLYEADQGRNFDGGSIRSYFELSHFFGEDPALNERFEQVQLHGYVLGVADLHLSRASNYEEIDDAAPKPNEPFILGASNDTAWKPELVPKMTKGRLTVRGWGTTVRIDHESEVEFPHILQMLTVANTERRRPER